jgi:hypothetical protein
MTTTRGTSPAAPQPHVRPPSADGAADFTAGATAASRAVINAIIKRVTNAIATAATVEPFSLAAYVTQEATKALGYDLISLAANRQTPLSVQPILLAAATHHAELARASASGLLAAAGIALRAVKDKLAVIAEMTAGDLSPTSKGIFTANADIQGVAAGLAAQAEPADAMTVGFANRLDPLIAAALHQLNAVAPDEHGPLAQQIDGLRAVASDLGGLAARLGNPARPNHTMRCVVRILTHFNGLVSDIVNWGGSVQSYDIAALNEDIAAITASLGLHADRYNYGQDVVANLLTLTDDVGWLKTTVQAEAITMQSFACVTPAPRQRNRRFDGFDRDDRAESPVRPTIH